MDYSERAAIKAARNKHAKNLILASVALLLCHLVTVQPSEVNALGMKIMVADGAIIRGAIALLVLHFTLAALTADLPLDSALMKRRSARAIYRNMYLSFSMKASRARFSDQEAHKIRRRIARGGMKTMVAIRVIHASALATLSVTALVIAFFDIYYLVRFLLG